MNRTPLTSPIQKEFGKKIKLTEKDQVYLLNHDKMFYEGWKCGIDTATKKLADEVKCFLNRAIPEHDHEFLPATEKRGGFFGYWVARLDNSYLRDKLQNLFYYLDSKVKSLE